MKRKGQMDNKGIKIKCHAKKFGVSEVTVSSWCRGRNTPKQKYLLQIYLRANHTITKGHQRLDAVEPALNKILQNEKHLLFSAFPIMEYGKLEMKVDNMELFTIRQEMDLYF